MSASLEKLFRKPDRPRRPHLSTTRFDGARYSDRIVNHILCTSHRKSMLMEPNILILSRQLQLTMRQVVGSCAFLMSALMALSMGSDLGTVVKTQTTQSKSIVPFIASMSNAALSSYYGSLAGNSGIRNINLFNLTVLALYTSLFFMFYKHKTTALSYLGASALLLGLVHMVVLSLSTQQAIQFVGVVGNLACIIMFASPLSDLVCVADLSSLLTRCFRSVSSNEKTLRLSICTMHWPLCFVHRFGSLMDCSVRISSSCSPMSLGWCFQHGRSTATSSTSKGNPSNKVCEDIIEIFRESQ